MKRTYVIADDTKGSMAQEVTKYIKENKDEHIVTLTHYKNADSELNIRTLRKKINTEAQATSTVLYLAPEHLSDTYLKKVEKLMTKANILVVVGVQDDKGLESLTKITDKHNKSIHIILQPTFKDFALSLD